MSTNDLSQLNVNLLVALDLLLQEQGVSAAAARAGVTPSAMSHSLRALRELLNDPLLIRTHGGMTPSPLALELAGPLHKVLAELANVIRLEAHFDPATARRSYVICAPDFISTLLAVQLAELLDNEAPGVDVEVRPLARVGDAMLLRQAAQLEEGSVDLVVGALLPQTPGLVREELYQEKFVCVVREGHPSVDEQLAVEQFAAIPQVLITITDDRSPSSVDVALAELGLTRMVRVRTRYFMMAPQLVAHSDLLLTCPRQLALFAAETLPLRILESPFELYTYSEYQAWHRRFDRDPSHVWFRDLVRRAARRATRGAAEPGAAD